MSSSDAGSVLTNESLRIRFVLLQWPGHTIASGQSTEVIWRVDEPLEGFDGHTGGALELRGFKTSRAVWESFYTRFHAGDSWLDFGFHDIDNETRWWRLLGCRLTDDIRLAESRIDPREMYLATEKIRWPDICLTFSGVEINMAPFT